MIYRFKVVPYTIERKWFVIRYAVDDVWEEIQPDAWEVVSEWINPDSAQYNADRLNGYADRLVEIGG